MIVKFSKNVFKQIDMNIQYIYILIIEIEKIGNQKK